MNPHAVALGRRGGRVRSEAKTTAARANARKRWDAHSLKPASAMPSPCGDSEPCKVETAETEPGAS